MSRPTPPADQALPFDDQKAVNLRNYAKALEMYADDLEADLKSATESYRTLLDKEDRHKIPSGIWRDSEGHAHFPGDG